MLVPEIGDTNALAVSEICASSFLFWSSTAVKSSERPLPKSLRGNIPTYSFGDIERAHFPGYVGRSR